MMHKPSSLYTHRDFSFYSPLSPLNTHTLSRGLVFRFLRFAAEILYILICCLIDLAFVGYFVAFHRRFVLGISVIGSLRVMIAKRVCVTDESSSKEENITVIRLIIQLLPSLSLPLAQCVGYWSIPCLLYTPP